MIATTPIRSTTESRGALVEAVHECGRWAVNPYEHCAFRCTYCITGVQGTSVPRGTPDAVVTRLRAELAGIDPEASIVLGGLCDAYPPVEAEAGVTRAIVAELARQARPISIVTKSDGVLRDIDLLLRAAAVAEVLVTVSLCSLDDAALARLDPFAPPAATRLATVRALVEAGLQAAVSVAPWMPGVTDVSALVSEVRRVSQAEIWVLVSPLNVRAPAVASSAFGRRWDQAEINAAYLAAFDAWSEQPSVSWLPPIPLEGRYVRTDAFTHLAECRVEL